MKTTTLSFLILCLCCKCFAQHKTLEDSVNMLIDHLYKAFDLNEVDLNKDGLKEIVAPASYVSEHGILVKVFVLARSNNKLTIIESSPALERDGRGPHIFVEGGKLIVEHAYHHEDNRLIYAFNMAKNRFMLTKLTTMFIDVQHGNDNAVRFEQDYDVANQRLTLHATLSDNTTKRTKTIHKAKPAGLSLLLNRMRDPGDYYKDLFISSGPVYDKMVKF